MTKELRAREKEFDIYSVIAFGLDHLKGKLVKELRDAEANYPNDRGALGPNVALDQLTSRTQSIEKRWCDAFFRTTWKAVANPKAAVVTGALPQVETGTAGRFREGKDAGHGWGAAVPHRERPGSAPPVVGITYVGGGGAGTQRSHSSSELHAPVQAPTARVPLGQGHSNTLRPAIRSTKGGGGGGGGGGGPRRPASGSRRGGNGSASSRSASPPRVGFAVAKQVASNPQINGDHAMRNAPSTRSEVVHQPVAGAAVVARPLRDPPPAKNETDEALERELAKPAVQKVLRHLGVREVKRHPFGVYKLDSTPFDPVAIQGKLLVHVFGGSVPFLEFLQRYAEKHIRETEGHPQKSRVFIESKQRYEIDDAVAAVCRQPGIREIMARLPPVERISVATGEMDHNQPIRAAMYSFDNKRVNVHMNGAHVLVAHGGGDIELADWIRKYLQ